MKIGWRNIRRDTNKNKMKTLQSHYQELLNEYGDPVKYWPQWCADKKPENEREKIIIGMILVQRVSWYNANIALKI